jgi:hypothetical protein
VTNPTLRMAAENDLTQLRALFAICFGHSRPEPYDRWRLFATPFGPAPTIVAELNGELIAAYTVWPTMLNIGGEVVRGAISMDTMTHPDHRGGGLFVKLALACFEELEKNGYEVLYGFPNTNSYPGFIRRLNWDHVTDVPFFRRWINRYRGRRAPLPLLGSAMAKRLPIVKPGEVTIDRSKPSTDAIAALTRTHTPVQNLCRIERDPAWLDWRYAPPSGRRYEWFCARTNGAIQGACAIGYDPADPRVIDVAELFGAPAVLPSLIGAVVAAADTLGAEQLRGLCLDPGLEAALVANGFERRHTTPLIVKALTVRPMKANIHQSDAWRIFGGDFDVV